MTMRHLRIAIFVAAVALAAAGPARAQDATAGAAVFASQCAICHAVSEGRNMVGPSLFGLLGRPAAAIPGYRYSAAMRACGLAWDAATLDRYLTGPEAVVPHTTMTYGGLRDAQTRADLIAYLSTLH
jgi:cytochrome c